MEPYSLVDPKRQGVRIWNVMHGNAIKKSIATPINSKI